MLRVFCGPCYLESGITLSLSEGLLFTLWSLFLTDGLCLQCHRCSVAEPAGIMVFAFPMAVLLGSLFLQQDVESGEIIAMQTGGVAFID